MGVRARQWVIAVVGAVLTVAMLWLGLWQMRVFEDKENESAAARAGQAPVPLLDFVSADGTVGDIYGKPASVTGHYLASQQARVTAEDGTVRVLTAFQLADGRVLAVVRGVLPAGVSTIPAPPSGELTQSGIFLPSEAGSGQGDSGTDLGTVRLPVLAQFWPQQLLPGFITLRGPDSEAQGLRMAVVALPTGSGSIQNIGYALQWWVFAAFGAFMTFRFVRALGRDGSLGTLADQEEE
ncbi:MAG TPA: SURF1 family protein [Propionicimonas sp.]|uniref:SURF1 family protein n=1 Tax=Propionicimonas sp. TaxID=1955623 RepID=UPI002F428470